MNEIEDEYYFILKCPIHKIARKATSKNSIIKIAVYTNLSYLVLKM